MTEQESTEYIEQINIFQVTHAFYDTDDKRDIRKVGLKGKLLNEDEDVTININLGDDTIEACYMSGHDHVRALVSVNDSEGTLKPLPNEKLAKIASGEIPIIVSETKDALEILNSGYTQGGIDIFKAEINKFRIPEKGERRPWGSSPDLEGIMVKREAEKVH